ncbi:MAG TPA: hypothetical protein VMB21_14850 [Candidatus Limnocylindria bacterium]|jgi:hypothetical protein|nr:hypothetical protein [Candidatus Limnocylindria bacterium]
MYFVTSQPEYNQLKARLQKKRTDESGWGTYYLDPEDGEEWVEYWPYHEDRSPSVLRKLNIPNDLETLLGGCLASRRKDDWRGVAAHFSGLSIGSDALLEILERRKGDFSAEALLVFGQNFELSDRRVIMGMNYDQVTASYEALLAKRKRIAEITRTG